MQASPQSYWLITIGKTALAIKANEVAFVSPIADLNKETGKLVFAKKEFDHYSLDENLILTNVQSDAYRFCVCLVSMNKYFFSISVDSIKSASFSNQQFFYTIPEVLANPLFDQLVDHNGDMLLVFSANKLMEYLGTQTQGISTKSTLLKVS